MSSAEEALPAGFAPHAWSIADGVSLYVHVPFCVSKCAYCDFESTPERDPAVFRAYGDAVLASLDDPEGPIPLLTDVVTVYVGGGTPTLLGEELVRTLAGIVRRVGVRGGAEVTVETNPETTEAGLAAALLDAGATRFSLGVQSFDDEVLGTLGRCHDAAQAEAASGVLHDSGASFSIDLICGVPGQTAGSWISTVLRAIATGAGHVSVYPLSVEEGTRLHQQIAGGGVGEVRPDEAAEQMLAAEELLEAAGLERYEVANYARPGTESRHNVGYWTGRPYVGVGPSAASMLDVTWARARSCAWVERVLPASCRRGGRVRFVGSTSHAGFLEDSWSAAATTAECLIAAEVAREDIMLGLRLSGGVTASAVEDAELTREIQELEELGLIEYMDVQESAERWRLTKRGWLLGNEVFRRVWTGE